MKAVSQKKEKNVPKMPVYVTIIGILLGTFLTTLGFYFYKQENQDDIIRYLYIIAAAANVNYILFLLSLWRELFSYGLAYFHTLILTCIIITFSAEDNILKDTELKPFSYLSPYKDNIPAFLLSQLGVYYCSVAIFLFIFCVLVYYTSILDEERFIFVRSAAFVFLNRLIVFISSFFILFFFTSIIYATTIHFPSQIQFSESLIFKYEPLDGNTLNRLGNLCLILFIPMIVTLIRPTSPIRQSLSKICHVILPLTTGCIMAISSYSLVVNQQPLYSNPTIHFYPLLIHSTTGFLFLIAFLELLLPRRPRSVLKNHWVPVEFP
ncbi:uncharacterized protein LOC128884113 [Hylaeus volcanicus]|uniref:uncharacterized protein LOC128884113 n=1 Tax=Hylaeus volcanicus TaxID=313075 RepID=UPI0023B82973|nr:uncharacterized protein LOC128884113 [Hylaeus volcanicus]